MTPKTIKIVQATYVREHQLRIKFSDGRETTVDFGPFLTSSRHSEIRKYLNLRRFRQFKVHDGELIWGDFDLLFPIIDLYENSIDRKMSDSA